MLEGEKFGRREINNTGDMALIGPAQTTCSTSGFDFTYLRKKAFVCCHTFLLLHAQVILILSRSL